jgi:hypothetical protein
VTYRHVVRTFLVGRGLSLVWTKGTSTLVHELRTDVLYLLFSGVSGIRVQFGTCEQRKVGEERGTEAGKREGCVYSVPFQCSWYTLALYLVCKLSRMDGDQRTWAPR